MHRQFQVMVMVASMVMAGACGSDRDDGSGFEVDTGLDASADGGEVADAADAEADTAADAEADTANADWASCSANSQCVLRANTCCGVCGQPTLNDVDAVNIEMTAAHYEAVCPEPGGPCPDCPEAPNPWLVASCQFGTCDGFDMAQEPATACQADADCVIRTTDCCECGGDVSRGSIIAIHAGREGMFADLVCDQGQICGACQPTYPPEASAVCGASGHCELVWQ